MKTVFDNTTTTSHFWIEMIAGGARLSDRRSSKKVICGAAAGATAGAIASTFVCTLDVIKTILQVHGLPEAHHSGPKGSIIITSLQNIIRTAGLKGLYRGLSPTLVALPNWAVHFTVYGYLKDLLHTHAKEILNPPVKCTVTGGAFDQVRLGETVKETEGVLGRVQLK
ncbi:unnamed protein product [Camellia sinensis]